MTRMSLRVDVQEWTQELTEVWEPTRILEVRNEGTLGLLFIALVPPGYTLHLRVQWDGVAMCTMWQGRYYVLWDRAIGLLSTPRSEPLLKEQEAWQAQMRALMRRNCFLMGCDVGATDEEKRQWLEEREASLHLRLPQTSGAAE